jgi:serine protease Do
MNENPDRSDEMPLERAMNSSAIRWSAQPAPRGGPRHLPWLLAILTLLALIASGTVDRLLHRFAFAIESGVLQATGDDLARVEEVANTFRKVARIARPGVVFIRVMGAADGDALKDIAERMRERFGDQLSEEDLQELLRRHREAPSGSGSGVIFDAEGYILTNNHVVGGRSAIRVRLNDEREFDAELVGTDPKSDLAVIKIKADKLTPLKFGDSDKAEVGDWVLAVGAPFGLAHTVTHGIVSAVGRSDVGVNIQYQDFIQTDAAINPGNSGGPLMNMRGEVIGINTAIATDMQGANAGVAFTIPSNMALKIARQLRQSGSVARGWLGIQMDEVTKDDARLFGAPEGQGVLVRAVIADTPAEKAGLQVEDVILALDGRPVEGLQQLRARIADLPPGQAVEFDVLRDGSRRTVKVTLERQPDALVNRNTRSTMVREVPQLGLEVLSLRAGIAQRAGFDDTQRGVLVVELTRDAAAKLDLKPNDLIVAVNDQRVATAGELAKLAASLKPDRPVKLQVLDPKGARRTVLIERP